MRRWCVLVLLMTGCHDDSWLSYTWDDRQVLCSQSIDDLNHDAPWDMVDDALARAAEGNWVALVHAHNPGATISLDGIDRLLTAADRRGLDYVTWAEIAAGGPPRAGLALAFDDNWPDQWFTLRDILGAHHAHVTFFVSRLYSFAPEQIDELDQLAAEGHALEPHTVHHLRADDYIHDHGLDAYMADEVLPSIQQLADLGYPSTSFAYPFGIHTEESDAAILQYVDKIRVSPGSCPY